MRPKYIFKKFIVLALIVMGIVSMSACGSKKNGDVTKLWKADAVITAFEDKGITIENKQDAKSSIGNVDGVNEAIAFTSGDIAGSIIIVKDPKEISAAKKQMEETSAAGFKFITNGNALVCLLKLGEGEFPADTLSKFEEALK